MNSSFLLAALGVDLPNNNRPFGKTPSLLLSDVLLIVGLGLAVLLVLALGVYISMRLRRRRRRHVSGGEKVYRGSHAQAEHDDAVASDSESDDASQDSDEDDHDEEHGSEHHHQHPRRRYKYRVRRRTHRTRNPTLSETGGLPPVKAEQPTKPI